MRRRLASGLHRSVSRGAVAKSPAGSVADGPGGPGDGSPAPDPGSFPIEEYLAEKGKVEPLIAAFDATVDSIPRTEADQPAADAFAAFRRVSDEADAELAAAAATGDQAVFDAAVDERHKALFDSPERQELEAVGINCDAR